MEKWVKFKESLPKELKNYLSHNVRIEDFEVGEITDETLLFRSPSTHIEVILYWDEFGASLSIWFADPYRNNPQGDPTFTELEKNWSADYMRYAAEILKDLSPTG